MMLSCNRFALVPHLCSECKNYIWLEGYRRADVALYPELKSDTLVQSQIEVYVENNKAIKELKSSAINASVYRWWLYFGE